MGFEKAMRELTFDLRKFPENPRGTLQTTQSVKICRNKCHNWNDHSKLGQMPNETRRLPFESSSRKLHFGLFFYYQKELFQSTNASLTERLTSCGRYLLKDQVGTSSLWLKEIGKIPGKWTQTWTWADSKAFLEPQNVSFKRSKWELNCIGMVKITGKFSGNSRIIN